MRRAAHLESSSARGAELAPTQWSIVLAAGGETTSMTQEAQEQFCRNYWYPVYAHVRGRGYSPDDAQDLTQEFFARLLVKRWLGAVTPKRGRFRSFLLTTLRHFLANEWDHVHAAKRGGGRTHLPIDTVAAEQLYAREPGRDLDAGQIYERNWALRLIERAHTRLREEYAARGKAESFDQWEQFLPGAEPPLSYALAAARLGIPEGTFKSEVFRLKKRYGDLIREEIAQTVSSPGEIDDELRHLMAVVSL